MSYLFIEHRPGVNNVVPDALSRQPMLELPIVEDSCSPEEGVTFFLVLALSADVLHHTPSLVSETLNGTLAYLRHVCLLTHSTVHPTASKPVEPETTEVDPVETSSKSGICKPYLDLTFVIPNLQKNNKRITGIALHLNSYPQEVTK